MDFHVDKTKWSVRQVAGHDKTNHPCWSWRQRWTKKTHGSKTRRVMYSLGMRGSWWEKTFCRPTSHMRIFLLDFWESELPITWNSIMPLLSSRRAVSSRAAFADRRLVWGTEQKKKTQTKPHQPSYNPSFYNWCGSGRADVDRRALHS